MHDAPTEVLTGAYPEEEYFDDLLRVTGGATDEALARLTIRGSAACAAWMRAHGVRFQPALGGTLQPRSHQRLLPRRRQGAAQRLLPGGRGARRSRCSTTPRSPDVALRGRRLPIRDGAPPGARARGRGAARWWRPPAASRPTSTGSREAWGDAGRQLPDPRHALTTRAGCCAPCSAQGVEPDRRCQAVPRGRDRRPRAQVRRRHRDPGRLRLARHRGQPRTAGGSTTRARTSGPSATRSGAAWSRSSRGRSATSIIDRKALGRFMPPVFPPCRRARSASSRRCSELDPDVLEETVRAFNAAVRPGCFDHSRLDDCRTEGLAPPKSHWARPLDTPPFYGYPLRPGITFTYLGVAVDARARVHRWRTAARRRTCSPPARSWPATCWARAISAASA